jgi:hypothetical protein
LPPITCREAPTADRHGQLVLAMARVALTSRPGVAQKMSNRDRLLPING